MQMFDGLAVYETERDGPCVVFVHGAMDRAAGMIRIARCLPTWNIIRYDRRGYGRSEADAIERGFDGPLIVGVGSESNERAHMAARLTAAEASKGTLQKIEGLGHGAPQTHPKQIAHLIKSALNPINL